MRFIATKSLMPGMILGKSIISRNKAFMLARGTTLNEKYITYLNEKGYLGAYITDSLSEDVAINECVSAETFEDGVNAVATGNVTEIISVSRTMVDEITSSDAVSVDLVDLRSYDDYTYHHSVNVGVYAVAVGRVLGLRGAELQELAIAALCHDLGKSKIPNDILNKPDRLSDEEYNVIKTHAKLSYDILYDNDKISASVRQAVLMHHENENGTGYPLGRTGDEIPKYAKIIHVCDVYDALTSKRPYKEPYSHDKAHVYMEGGKNAMFDATVVDAMKKVVPMYPAGVTVMLSNGEEAIVLSQTSDTRRPKIRLKSRDKVINLHLDADYRDVRITGSTIYDNAESLVGDEVESLNESRSAVRERKKTIMVVDDSPISLMQTKAALGTDYEVIAISAGIDAIAHIKQNGAPDLIFMDIEMPVLNGISAVRSIRESGYKDLPVIFLTASCDRETVMRGKAVGAVDYIIKPANPVYLLERATAALEGESQR